MFDNLERKQLLSAGGHHGQLAAHHVHAEVGAWVGGGMSSRGSIGVASRSQKMKSVVETNLVSDQAGVAAIQDPSLVNAWGISLSQQRGAFWISDNGADVVTLYAGDVNGTALSKVPLTVSIPGGAPTGQVFNSTSDFMVSNGTTSDPAVFIFASEAGSITGWSPAVPPINQAHTGVTVPDAVYKGLAIGSNSSGNFLFAANFHSGKIDVFDTSFHQMTMPGGFVDSKIPKGYAPFNIENLGGNLYVTYAKQDPQKHDDVAGQGHGFVDVFNTSGQLVRRLVKHGQLNSPWGLAIAPANFGAFRNALLVGNFGNGRINAFNPKNGKFLGSLLDANTRNKPLVIDGLWGLTLGNGVTAGASDVLYFTAGPGGESHGLFGRLNLKT